MKLTFKERIIIPNILPKKGGFDDLIVKDDLKNKIVITQNEMDKYDLQTLPNGEVRFKKEGEIDELEFPLTTRETSMISEVLKKMNEEKTLDDELISLYKKFIL